MEGELGLARGLDNRWEKSHPLEEQLPNVNDKVLVFISLRIQMMNKRTLRVTMARMSRSPKPLNPEMKLFKMSCFRHCGFETRAGPSLGSAQLDVLQICGSTRLETLGRVFKLFRAGPTPLPNSLVFDT